MWQNNIINNIKIVLGGNASPPVGQCQQMEIDVYELYPHMKVVTMWKSQPFLWKGQVKWANAGLMLVHRFWRWTNIKPALAQRPACLLAASSRYDAHDIGGDAF